MPVKTAILLHAPLRPAVEPPWAAALLGALPYAWRLRLESRPRAALVASLGGVALALCGATRLRKAVPDVRALVASEGAKPRFAEGPCFSVSHTDDTVACVVSPGGEVGLDVESFQAQCDRDRLLRWTATEAVLKAAGRGIREWPGVTLDADLSGGVIDGRRYVLRAVELADACRGWVAAASSIEFAIETVELDGPDVSTAVECSLGLLAQGR